MDNEIAPQPSELYFEDIARVPPQLYTGVFLDGENKKLYWVDGKTKTNCFMLFPRSLEIINDDERYWEWEKQSLNVEGICQGNIEIVRLKEVCWLEVRGSFDVSKLSSKTWYMVLLEVKLDDGVDKWGGWSHINLTLPEYKKNTTTRVKHEHKVNMKAQERRKWVEIPVGVFNTSIITQGKIEFSLLQRTPIWKTGIEIRSAKIQPLEEY